jgi:hypothetical protein
MSSIPASSSTTIQIWYGNPNATSVANGDAVFLFFDDFLGTSLNTTKWTVTLSSSNITVSVSDGLLIFAGASDGSTWVGYTLKSTTMLPNLHEIIARVKWSMTSDATAVILNNYSSTAYQQFYYNSAWKAYFLRTYIQGVYYFTSFSMLNDNPANFEYWKLRYNGSYLSAHRSLNGADWAELLARNTNIITSGFTAGVQQVVRGTTTNYYYVDYVAAKKYVEPEPSASVGNEILAKPDLTIISADYSPKPASVQQQVNISAQIANIGNWTSPIANVTLYINGNAVQTAQISGLNPNETATITLAWTPNATGSYTAAVVVDPENAIDEINEDNNAYNLTVEVIRIADLTVNIATPLTGITDKTITFNVTVTNAGSATANSFNLIVYLDSTKIDEKSITSLDPHGQITFSYSFTPHEVRTYTMSAVVDPENNVVESREDNNIANVSVKILGYAVKTPTPPKPEGKTLKEIYEDLTLKTYNLPLEMISLIALLGIAVVGYGFGAFKGTVNLFFLSVLYYIATNALGWSTYIATGLLVVSAVLLVIVVAFLKED